MGSRDRIGIVGMAMINGPQLGKSRRMLTAEVARLAIADAGIDHSQVDGAIEGGHVAGGGDRRGYADAFPRMLNLPVNFYYTSGRGSLAMAIAQAAALLRDGHANYVCIATAVDTRSQAEQAKKGGHIGRPFDLDREGYWGRPVGDLRAVSHHSWMAARHMAVYGTTSEQLGAIAVSTRQWANLNPKAQMYGRPMTVEDHQNSPLVVAPYHLFDISQVSDGAFALVMTRWDRAEDTKKPAVEVLGQGFWEIQAEYWWEKKNYTHMAVGPARDKAFSEAGIKLSDLDAAMLYDCFTAEVLFQLEDYGWCEKGEGGPFAQSGAIAPGGTIPINTSGGLLSAYHLADTVGLAEAIQQLRGGAGDRQISPCQTVMSSAHGNEVLSPGMCSFHATTVLGTGR